MSSPLDLTTLQRVKTWLGINTLVNTTIAGSISTGVQTVTPATMANITPNTLLAIGSGATLEIVAVISTTPTTFVALFAVAHVGPGIVVTLAVDALVPDLITSAGVDWLTMLSQGPNDGSIPTVSPLVQVCPFNEWYDGSGSARQFIRNPPAISGTLVTVNGTTIPQSTGPNVPGWVIADQGSSFAIRQGGYSRGYSRTFSRGIGWQGSFCEGVQNVNLQYNGGYASTPPDIIQACTEMVGLTFRKRQWIGQKSQALPAGGGTVSYQDWAIEPNVARVIDNYKRRAMV